MEDRNMDQYNSLREKELAEQFHKTNLNILRLTETKIKRKKILLDQRH